MSLSQLEPPLPPALSPPCLPLYHLALSPTSLLSGAYSGADEGFVELESESDEEEGEGEGEGEGVEEGEGEGEGEDGGGEESESGEEWQEDDEEGEEGEDEEEGDDEGEEARGEEEGEDLEMWEDEDAAESEAEQDSEGEGQGEGQGEGESEEAPPATAEEELQAPSDADAAGAAADEAEYRSLKSELKVFEQQFFAANGRQLRPYSDLWGNAEGAVSGRDVRSSWRKKWRRYEIPRKRFKARIVPGGTEWP